MSPVSPVNPVSPVSPVYPVSPVGPIILGIYNVHHPPDVVGPADADPGAIPNNELPIKGVKIYKLLSAVPPPNIDSTELLFKITSSDTYVYELL